jgi:hypothetical protein
MRCSQHCAVVTVDWFFWAVTLSLRQEFLVLRQIVCAFIFKDQAVEELLTVWSLKMAVIWSLETSINSPKDTLSLPRWPESSTECNIHFTAHLPKCNVPIPLWFVNIYTLSVKLRSHSIEGNKNRIQEHCTGISRRCTQVSRERRKGILLSRTLYASNLHLLNQRVYCRCSKPPLSAL